MVDRVAAAIAGVLMRENLMPTLSRMQAIAAIEAMREPTEAMVRKFNALAQCEGFFEEGWNAMIDEALGTEVVE